MIAKQRFCTFIVLLMLLSACKYPGIGTHLAQRLDAQTDQVLANANPPTTNPSPATSLTQVSVLTATESGEQTVLATATAVPTVKGASEAPPSSKTSTPPMSAGGTTSPDDGEQPLPPSGGASPQISSFSATPARVKPGDAVTLSWNAVGFGAAIGECLSSNDGHLSHPCFPGEYMPVPLVGTRTVRIPEDARYYVDFILAVKGSAEGQPETDKYQTLSVEVTCPITWFFGAAPATDSSCPQDEVVTSAAAWQNLEHGAMMWKESTHDIVVFFDDGHLGGGRDQWDSSMSEYDPSIVPPDGLYQPVRGFGLIWRGQKDTLGWATAPEFSFQIVYQCSVYRWHESNCYYRDPAGRIIGTDFLGLWRVVKQ